MTWLAWRQFRTQAAVVFGALLVLAIPVVVTGNGTRAWVARCAASGACLGVPAQAYAARFGWLQILLGGGLLVLPAVTGIFWAAPLVARELDTGTYRLVWTQSVSRVRWLTVKVLVVGLASVLASGLLSWMTTWWFGPLDQVSGDKFIDSTFGIRDVAPLGYAVFAFGVGLAAGLVLRKVLPAMAVTLVAYAAARFVVQVWVRAHYAAALTQAGPLNGPGGDTSADLGGGLPPGSWVVRLQILDSTGQRIDHPLDFGPGAPCAAAGTCFQGYSQQLAYQPGSRYWPFQWTEAGLFALVGLLLVAVSYWWIAGRGLPGRTRRTTSRGAAHAVDPELVLAAEGLGKRYGRRWALTDCDLSIPAGRVVGLVGPNGAGKSTLLNLAVGLLPPTEGRLEVLGRRPVAGAALAGVGFVAQGTPTYAALTVADHLRLGARLNPSWDRGFAEERVAGLGLNPAQRAGTLSGGEQAQLALTIAVAKRPRLLLLDEPVASLDPLARREFLQGLMEVVAEREVSVVLSSHLVTDLERVCDHLVVLVDSRVRLAGDVDDLLADHHLLIGPFHDMDRLPSDWRVVHQSHTPRQSTLLVRTDRPILDPSWAVDQVGLEDLVLAYMSDGATHRRLQLR